MEIYPLFFTAMHFLLFLCASSAVHSNFTDLSALLAFKASLGDPYRVLATNWTTSTSFCTWTGVSCDSSRQRVVSLNIVNTPLYGTIAPNIANLSLLSYLNLTNNSLSGPIPGTLSQLSRLTSLSLRENGLSGSLPPSIFNMSLLTKLDLQSNNLTGTLPLNRSIHPILLPLVRFLAVSDNQLSGSIPSSLSYFRHLRILSLSYNQFSGSIPSELGSLHELRALLLGSNDLTGTIPPSLGNLTNLLSLEFNFNYIHGIIPEEFGGLSNLHRLITDGNHHITGPLPISLSNVSSLEILDLTVNQVSGPIHVQVGNMPHLRTLFLGGNKITGELELLLSSLSNCRNLTFLELGGNELEGSLPKNYIGNLSTNLLSFGVSLNNIKGEIPVEFGNLTSLWKTDLGYNELIGKIPSEIMKLKGLQSLVLENNRLSGLIPAELGQLGNLNVLSLSGNNLSGPLPGSLGNISRLQHLDLSANALSSRIPESLWSLTGLIDLYLSQNFLDGLLSSGVGNIKSLDTFNISMNRLSGNIPSALKELQMIRYLDLSYNSFEGKIPEIFGKFMMNNLEVLNLSCNTLSGSIPTSLASLRHIISLNLSFNSLEGKIPNAGVFLNLTDVSLIGNAALCEEPSRLRFPPCPTNATASNSWLSTHLLKHILPAIIAILVLVACCYFLWKSLRKETEKFAPINPPSPENYRLISYRELVLATQNFSNANLLGRGSFGSVYKGCLDDGLLVAVKVLNLEVDGASRSFEIECRTLSMVRHRNLVKIISTCSNLDFKALVLQFLTNGSLEEWLYSKDYHLNLLQRINIVLDVASALEYLHHGHPQVVLHCDLKPSNVLLDEDMTAHVGDFGIAKLLLGESWTVTTINTPGTIGYIAPEYASTGRVSRRGDVYSFGMLLLETFTRKRPTDPMFCGESTLRLWVYEARAAALFEIVDCDLLKDGSGNRRPSKDLISMHACLSSIIELGLRCSSDNAKERPLMIEVVPILQRIKVDCLSKFP